MRPSAPSGQSKDFFSGKTDVPTAEKLSKGRLGFPYDPNDNPAILIDKLNLRVGIDLILASQFLRDGHLSFCRNLHGITLTVVFILSGTDVKPNFPGPSV
jgi:hypothetical protein